MREILFRSDTLELRRVRAGDGRRLVITFDCYHDEPGFDRPAFGEAFLARAGIDALHLLTHRNDWFHAPDLPAALAAIRAAAAGAERRLAYGSSMGGYAALRHADAVAADAVLALSPQHAIHPRRAAFDGRWVQDRARLRHAVEPPIGARAAAVVAFDPWVAADAEHARRIAAETTARLLPLPHAGHPVGTFLAELGLLAPLVRAMLAGAPDLAAVAAVARARRAEAATWLGGLAAAQPAHRPRLAVTLAQRAVAARDDDAAAWDRLALRLRAAGEHEAAIAAHRRAEAIEPSAAFRWNLSKTLHAAGDIAQALAVARQVQAQAPDVAGHHRWAAALAEQAGDTAAARRDLARAIAAAPANRGYRAAALRLRLRAWRDALARAIRGGR